MKNIFISIALIIFSLNLVSSLIITQNPLNLTAKVNENKTIQVEFINNLGFDIFDFKFSNLSAKGFTIPVINIQANSSQIIPIVVKTTQSYHGLLDSKVEFKYTVNLPDEQETFYVDITEMGFSPNFLIIKQDDTITWRNKDDLSHTVVGSGFNLPIAPNQSASYTFPTIGETTYQDSYWYFSGSVNVINKTSQQNAHNPNYDLFWNINLDSILNPTNLEINLLDTQFEVQATGQTEGMIKIKNLGPEKAEIINLNSGSDWISFTENNFNLNMNENKYITYKINPIIFETNQTNKTYDLPINIKASNSDLYNYTISVYIPYSSIVSDFDSEEGFLIWFAEVYCPAHPNNFICNTSINQGNGSTIYKESEIPINVTARTIYEIKRDIARMTDSYQRSDNKITSIQDQYGNSLPNIESLLNQSLTRQEKNEKENSRNWNLVIIVGFFIALFVMFSSLYNKFKKMSYNKYLMEGQFRYR